MLSQTEENYLKAIYNLSGKNGDIVSTNAVADAISTKPASATVMVQRLSKKGLLTYHRYQGVSPTEAGAKAALSVIRKHRLWEVFLVQKLKFKWDEVHDVAEQLEHVNSPMLIEQLDRFLGSPKYDPHGDPIPNEKGEIEAPPTTTLNMLSPGENCKVVSAKDSSTSFLNYLDKVKISLAAQVSIIDHFDFDDSYSISVDGSSPFTISKKAAENIYVEQL